MRVPVAVTFLLLTLAGPALALVVVGTASAQSRDIGVEAMRSEPRIALVIGNAAYASSPLRNPANDARAMAETLRGLGFHVLAHQNLGEKGMKRAIQEFGDRLRGGGVGVFFYAGHGIQVAGRNYLVPIDAQIRTELDVDIEAIDVARVLARMDEARNRLNIVVLDACRDNPFGRSFRSSSRGLAAIDAPSGTLIAYATAPGKLASDGEGQNGLYTGELVRAMREPGVKLEDVFKRVRQAVRTSTKGEQIPWEASSVEGDFFFNLKIASPAPTPTGPPKLEGREENRFAGSVSQTFGVPLDYAWATTERVLKALGWDIDKADRAIGGITTDSRSLEGGNYGVYAKGTRHRLRINIKAEGDRRTTISVERTVFKRERILWIDKDEPLTVTDQKVEKDLLAAIGKSL